MLDQQPAAAAAGAVAVLARVAPRAHQYPGSLQFVAVERELQVAFRERAIDVVRLGCPGAAIPQHHDTGAVALRNHAFKLAVLDGMIFHVHREAFRLGIDGRTLRYGPRQQRAVVLEPEVVVEVTREVLLYAEKTRRRLGLPARFLWTPRRFGRPGEIALAAVFVERPLRGDPT